MVRIRLRRVGGKNQPSFRIVAADKESPRDGRFIEILGYYNPRTEPATIQLKEDRIYDWMGKGAQPSDSAMQIFRTAGLIERFERFKAGEDVETLVAEAAAAAGDVDPRTRRPAPESAPNNKKKTQAKAAAEAAAAEAEAPAEEAEAQDAAPEEAPAEEAEAEEAQAEDASEEPQAEESADDDESEAEEAADSEESETEDDTEEEASEEADDE